MTAPQMTRADHIALQDRFDDDARRADLIRRVRQTVESPAADRLTANLLFAFAAIYALLVAAPVIVAALTRNPA